MYTYLYFKFALKKHENKISLRIMNTVLWHFFAHVVICRGTCTVKNIKLFRQLFTEILERNIFYLILGKVVFSHSNTSVNIC
jgi:hypothetical protein